MPQLLMVMWSLPLSSNDSTSSSKHFIFFNFYVCIWSLSLYFLFMYNHQIFLCLCQAARTSISSSLISILFLLFVLNHYYRRKLILVCSNNMVVYCLEPNLFSCYLIYFVFKIIIFSNSSYVPFTPFHPCCRFHPTS